MKAGEHLIERSSGNLFADLGFDAGESVNLAMRADCMMALVGTDVKLTQGADFS